MTNNPRAVFERLFGDVDSTDRTEQLVRLREQRSILDGLATRASTSSRNVACVCRSLKRMLNLARACPAITLLAALPTSTEVNSRFEAWNCALP